MLRESNVLIFWRDVFTCSPSLLASAYLKIKIGNEKIRMALSSETLDSTQIPTFA